MPDISKQRLLHELPKAFNVPERDIDELVAQMSQEDRDVIARFSSGFDAEDWYHSLYSTLPWSVLVHGLDQNQLPPQSKSKYQVPDFLVIVETTLLKHVPFLIEVKRAKSNKRTLKIRGSQASLTEEYSERLGIQLLYATHWDLFGLWTINTLDSFEKKSSRRQLSIPRAIELDCSGIFGDASFIAIPPMIRKTIFSKEPTQESEGYHQKHGTMVSDSVEISGRRISLEVFQSAAIDAVFEMKQIEKTINGPETTITESLESTCSIKLSWWIARHLAKFDSLPESSITNVSANVIVELADQLNFQRIHLFPWNATPEIANLQRLCFDDKSVSDEKD